MAAKTSQSKKAKGRSLQKKVVAELLRIGKAYGIQDGDVQSRSMGANGEDVILSPKADEVFGKLKIECKNSESLNVMGTFLNHAARYEGKGIPLLVHKRNRTTSIVVMGMSDFADLLTACVSWWDERRITSGAFRLLHEDLEGKKVA